MADEESLASMGQRDCRPHGAPFVTIELQTAEFWLVALGFGLFRTWSVVAGSPTVFVPLHSMAFAVGNKVALTEDIVYAALLLLMGCVALRWPGFSRRGVMVGGTTALCVATAYFGVACYFDGASPAATAVARIAFAFAAPVVVVWAEQLCRFSPLGIVACAAAAYGLAYGSALVMTWFPPGICTALHAAFPLASTAAWAWVRHRRLTDEPRDAVLRGGRPRVSTMICVLVGVGCYGAILLLANGFSEGKTSLPDEFLTLWVGLGTSLLVMVGLLVFGRLSDLALVFRLMLPILVLCVSAVFFIEAGQQPYEVAIIGFAWTFYIIFTWGLWGSMVRATRIAPVAVFAFGSVCLSLCTLGGGLLCDALAGALSGNFGISAGACIAAALVSTFLLNEQKVRAVTGGTMVPPLDVRDDESCRNRVEEIARGAQLTQREREIARLVLQGHDNPAIAQELSISSATLYTHLRNIYKKTGTHGRQELIDWIRGT